MPMKTFSSFATSKKPQEGKKQSRREELTRQQLPQQDAVRVHVRLLVVRRVRDDLGCHPPVRARLGGHHPSARVQQARDAEVGDLDAARIVEEEVRGLEVAVHHAALVEVVHAARDLGAHLEED
jgi:hypothetical protein